jgi:chromosomal replication initiation ATPase DnaA
MTSRQMTLDLAGAPRFGVEDFMVSASNEAAFAAIERWPNWAAPWLLLTGPRGAGKSHLAAIWAARAGARIVSAAALDGADPPTLAARPLAVEDADRIGGAEAALFHLLNLMRESGAALLLTASCEPSGWGLRTPDLLSRLRLAPTVALEAPDDALMRAALVKLFVDRQLGVDVGVVELLALHLDRSLDAARRCVEALDARSLAERRRITRAMAREAVGAGAQRDLFDGED